MRLLQLAVLADAMGACVLFAVALALMHEKPAQAQVCAQLFIGASLAVAILIPRVLRG